LRVTYNGIPLTPITFHEFSQKALYSEDGSDFESMHYTIDCEATWNPLTVASLNGQPVLPPAGVRGDVPAISIATLRELLQRPRGQLIVDIGGNVVLQSPATYFVGGVPTQAPMDLRGGPKPIHVSVTKWQGIPTATVRFKIETWLDPKTAPPSFLLSNRWDQSEQISEDFKSTIISSGVVTFRLDSLKLLQGNNPDQGELTPDSFRSVFLPPVKNGYQRTGARVALSSDNTRIAWETQDEQQVIHARTQAINSTTLVMADSRPD
jgi:hypothetical protein